MGSLWVCLVAVLCSAGQVSGAVAQQKKYAVWGTVRDLHTKSTLPYANIRVENTGLGTTSNEAGMFLLLLPPGSYVIRFDYIGYRSFRWRVEVTDTSVHRDVFLEPTVVPLREVTVVAERYNPAEKVILKATANKKRALRGLRSYRFRAYTRTVLRVPSKRSGNGREQIGGILETETVGYWKAHDRYKEVIVARRQTANFTPAQNIFTVGRIPNLNDDVVMLDRNAIVGPTAPNALQYYSYEMLDTVAIDHHRVFRIRLSPKSRTIPLFTGVISIVDSSFCVVEVDVGCNEAVDLGLIQDVRYRERFALYEERFWLPIHVRVSYRIRPVFPGVPEVRAEQISVLHDYDVNPELPDRLFDAYEISAAPDADRVPAASWALRQRLPLTLDEKRAYRRIDSLMTQLGLFGKAVFSAIRLPLSFRGWPLTSFSDFFRFNRVEGPTWASGFALADYFRTPGTC